MKVKIITQGVYGKESLQDLINNFLDKERFAKLIDIKYSSYPAEQGSGTSTERSAMIIYEEINGVAL